MTSYQREMTMVLLHLLRENNVSAYVEIYKRILKIAKRSRDEQNALILR